VSRRTAWEAPTGASDDSRDDCPDAGPPLIVDRPVTGGKRDDMISLRRAD